MKATKADCDAVLEVIRQHPEGITGAQIREALPHLTRYMSQSCTSRLRREGRIIRRTSDRAYSPIWVVK